MKYCPRAFGEDMDAAENLQYCLSVQSEQGENCRRKRCRYAVAVGSDGGEKVNKVAAQSKPGRSQDGLF